MDAAADRPEFAPPKQEQIWRGLGLAVLAHALLFVGLTHGLRWQRESQNAAVEAELWAAVPREAAPPAPPPPPPAPEPPKPVPPPPPVVKAPPEPDLQAQREAQIALEREKKRELERQKKEELEREREERRKLEAKKKHEQELAQKKHEEELAKKKEQQRLLAEAKRKEEEKKRKEQEAKEAREAKRREEIRKEQIERSLAMAGTGSPSSTGTAARSAGPSGGWAARVIGKVRPNIVFTDIVAGNPEAVVEIRLAPDGTIVSRKLKKSSGVKEWDEAVLRALDKTEVLPRDVDGSVPRGGEIVFRPKG